MLFELFPSLWFAPVVATLVMSSLIGLAAWALVYRTPIFNRFLSVEFDSVFCTMLNLIFVFFLAFMGSDFHANYKSATDNLADEKAAVNRLLHTQMPTEALSLAKQAALKDYLENVVTIEWRQHFNRQEIAEVQNALDRLNAIGVQARRDCLDSASSTCMDALEATSYAKSIDDLRQARDHRLAIGALERQTLRYLLCMFLAFNAAVSILALYRKDQRAAIVPLVMFCASVWVAFLIVVLHAEPYVGIRGIEPAALDRMLHSLT